MGTKEKYKVLRNESLRSEKSDPPCSDAFKQWLFYLSVTTLPTVYIYKEHRFVFFKWLN